MFQLNNFNPDAKPSGWHWPPQVKPIHRCTLRTIIFPSFLGSSRNSRKNCSRSLLANYFRELNKVPDLVLIFGNQTKVRFSSRISLFKWKFENLRIAHGLKIHRSSSNFCQNPQKGSKLSGKIAGGPLIQGFIVFLLSSVLKFAMFTPAPVCIFATIYFDGLCTQ